MGDIPYDSPGTVQPRQQVHKQDGLAKEVGQQDGQPNLSMVLQPVEDGGGRQEQTPQHLA